MNFLEAGIVASSLINVMFTLDVLATLAKKDGAEVVTQVKDMVAELNQR